MRSSAEFTRLLRVRDFAQAIAYRAFASFEENDLAKVAEHDAAGADMLSKLNVECGIVVQEPANGPETYIVQTDGYLRETELGLSREAIVADIANGEYEASRVLRMQGDRIDDVTDAIAAEVLAAVEASSQGRNGFVPSFLTAHLPGEAEDLRQSWMSPAERRADWEDANADRLRDERNERVLEAAE